MKISKEVLGDLIGKVQKAVPSEEVETEDGVLATHFMDDLSLSFTSAATPVFYGLTFETLGREFSCLANLEVLIAERDEDGEEVVYVIEDQEFLNELETYLRWRASIIDRYKL